MKKDLLVIMILAFAAQFSANAAYVQVADGVFQDGTSIYICSNVTSLGNLQLNPSDIYCYTTIPPACLSTTFSTYNATLHVPTSSMVSYFTTQYWYNFTNVKGDAVEPQAVTISLQSVEVEIGRQFSLSVTVNPSNATPTTVYFSSTNTSVATINDGTVTAVGLGECYIRAICVDKQALCHVTVTPIHATITLDKHEVRLLPNHLMTLTATCSPATNEFVVASSNPSVAIPRIVNGTIQVIGVAEGAATITVATADGWCYPAECQVIVYTELGDANCDGYVNIADVTTLIDFMLDGNASQLNLTNADTDKDGSVNIADVTEMIDFLLRGYWSWELQPEIETITVNGVTFNMVSVRGGTFTMGATAEQFDDMFDWEMPTHQVTLSNYSIGETEVTQKLWKAVMGKNPSCFTGDLQCPVESVSWIDCKTFITKLNKLTGMTFRLPTEAEWEFAARGGNLSHGYKYSGSFNIDDVAWYCSNSNFRTHPVATLPPNELGLYDMSGNVWEWCQDLFSIYTSEAQTNPTGPSSGMYHVGRGGSYNHYPVGCRISFRNRRIAGYKNSNLGLRLAMTSDF